LREFEKFPDEVRTTCLTALTIAAEGGKADIAKPMKGLGSGVVEVALPFSGRSIPPSLCGATRRRLMGHSCFSEEINTGIKTPKHEIDLIKDRLKRLREMLR
jgi:phage-related protein